LAAHLKIINVYGWSDNDLHLGIVLTKLDGTAKGGVIVAIANELKIPVKFIGIGERLGDLREFKADEFVEALFLTGKETLH